MSRIRNIGHLHQKSTKHLSLEFTAIDNPYILRYYISHCHCINGRVRELQGFI
jgi:hypothetical protein